MTGDDLQALRKSVGLTQAEMARMIGLTLRPYIEVEHKGAEEIRKLHRLAVERVVLHIAAERGDPMLAPASVRRDAVTLTKIFAGK